MLIKVKLIFSPFVRIENKDIIYATHHYLSRSFNVNDKNIEFVFCFFFTIICIKFPCLIGFYRCWKKR